MRWAVACGWLLVGLIAVWRGRAHRGRTRLVWWAVAAVSIGLAVETAYPLRFALTQSLRDGVRAAGGADAIAARRPVQAGVVVAVLAVAAFVAHRAARTRALGRPEKIALLGIGLGLTGLVLETVSLHYLDQTRFVYPAFRAAGLIVTAAGIGFARPPLR